MQSDDPDSSLHEQTLGFTARLARKRTAGQALADAHPHGYATVLNTQFRLAFPGRSTASSIPNRSFAKADRLFQELSSRADMKEAWAELHRMLHSQTRGSRKERDLYYCAHACELAEMESYHVRTGPHVLAHR